MNEGSELAGAFDAAIEQTRKCLKTGMTTASGEPARPLLEALERALQQQREISVDKGVVDRDWLQTTVRSVVAWLPETELALIAAFGRIARADPSSQSLG